MDELQKNMQKQYALRKRLYSAFLIWAGGIIMRLSFPVDGFSFI